MLFIETRATLTQIAYNNGLKLESIKLYHCVFHRNPQFDLFLLFCPELKTLSLMSYALFIALIKNQSLTKLKAITGLHFQCENVLKFKKLVDKYCHSLEGLGIKVWVNNVDYIHLFCDTIEQISRLKKLKSLKLWIFFSPFVKPVIQTRYNL